MDQLSPPAAKDANRAFVFGRLGALGDDQRPPSLDYTSFDRLRTTVLSLDGRTTAPWVEGRILSLVACCLFLAELCQPRVHARELRPRVCEAPAGAFDNFRARA
jgi:hypothetical protein